MHCHEKSPEVSEYPLTCQDVVSYCVIGSHVFPEKALVNNGNIPFVWEHTKECWGSIVSNNSVYDTLLKNSHILLQINVCQGEILSVF